MPRPRMTLARPSALLAALVALPLALAGCSQGDSASGPTSSADGDFRQDHVRTQKGGGTITLTGDYSAEMTFDSVYCVVWNGELASWRAPVVLDENGDPSTPEGVDSAEGTATGFNVTSAKGEIGTATDPDLAVDGDRISFREIPLTMMVGDAFQDTVATGDLTCSAISEFTG